MKAKKNIFLPIAMVTILLFLSSCRFDSGDSKATAEIQPRKEYSRNDLSIHRGTILFNERCANCHNFYEDEIGPGLAGITSKVEKDWIIAFIKDPKGMIESGDERAVESFETYKMYMPGFPDLEEQQMEDLLAFINKFSEGEKKNENNRPGGLINPIPEKVPKGPLSISITEAFTVPASASEAPLARINKMSAIQMSGRERLFIVDLRGKLYEIKDGQPQVYFDLKQQKPALIDRPGYGTGFANFAFHPDFEVNGLLYTTHTEPTDTAPADFTVPDSVKVALQWVLTEWKTEKPGSDAFSGQPRELLRSDMYGKAHGFQEITFNPLAKPGTADYGKLYLGIGDGASVKGGHSYLLENTRGFWASIVRIDPSGRNSKNGRYGIPEDNPYVDHPEILEEIWARGLRNPHRITWDEGGSGKMIISQIGQRSVEEVNIGKAGLHYGWPVREGTFLYDVNANSELVYPLPPEDSGYTYPVVQYDHDEGNAISGGYAYSGNDVPQLKGKYIFGDIPRGVLFYSELDEMELGQQAPIYKLGLEMEGRKTDLQSIVQNDRVDLRFGTDSSGELYIFAKSNGKVYKVSDARMDVL